MPKRALTDAAVKRLKPPAAGQVDVFDQGFPGLSLRISYGGGKSWAYFYRIGGRLRRMSLGTYPALSLAEAREAWRNARHRGTIRERPRDCPEATKPAPRILENVFDEWLRRDQFRQSVS